MEKPQDDLPKPPEPDKDKKEQSNVPAAQVAIKA